MNEIRGLQIKYAQISPSFAPMIIPELGWVRQADKFSIIHVKTQ